MVRYSTYVQKEKVARQRGRLITFKKPVQSPYNGRYIQQGIVESVRKQRDGSVEVDMVTGVLLFDSMRQYLDMIDWEWMRK